MKSRSVKVKKMIAAIAFLVAAMCVMPFVCGSKSYAADDDVTVSETAETEESATGSKALAAAIAIASAAGLGALGMGLTIAKAEESMAKQPEKAGDIRTSMMLGLVFIETAIIYALIVSILIIFVM